MSTEFVTAMNDAGFALIGWYDIGVTRAFSEGFDLRAPAADRGKKPFVWRDDVTFSATLQTIGGVASVSLNIPEVLPNLNTGASTS